LKKFLKILGPGLLYAGAAVGVSHLVQSTRAGAMFNFDLVWVLLLANFLKYPFFEFGPRYAIATGKNLVDGYRSIGKWAVVLFAILTVASMFIIQAAVTVVTVSLLAFMLGWSIKLSTLSIIVLLISVLILLFGKYSLLDKLIKLVIVVLAVSTVVAVFAALGIEKVVNPDAITSFKWTKGADILFLISFVGWMPAPIDISVWSSLWNLAKVKELGYTPDLNSTLNEFRVGYIGTALLAVGFLALGALIMYGSGDEFSNKGTVFSEQLIRMYTTSIGKWSFWIISLAAFTTMFSTTITVLDAYPRVLNPIVKNLFPEFWKKIKNKNSLIVFWLVLLVIGAWLMIAFGSKSMIHLITIATVISFLMAPLMAWLNLKVVTGKRMPVASRPGTFLRILSWTGIAFLVGFPIIYLYWVVAMWLGF
jgi:Mn2+/Fe2+ NRAMP family transporter